MKLVIIALLVLVASLDGHLVIDFSDCNFPAIFNFGDSNSDTGAAAYLWNSIHWPNGMTLGKVSKRASDGLLLIDFLAESLGLPYLNASVDTNGTSFRCGANFAMVAQTINPQLGPYSFDKQVCQFLDFKSKAIASKEQDFSNIYPNPESFSEALYTIDIGQNDVAKDFNGENVSTTLDYFTNSVQILINNGAKYIWVHNTCPYGCLPKSVSDCGKDVKTCTRDEYGCIMEYNELSQEFNLGLKERIDDLRERYPYTVLTLVDIYAAKYHLITDHIQGFDDRLKMEFCCGTKELFCGIGTTYACKNPSKYISWDGVHYTQAANKVLAELILNGTYSHPQRAVWEACRPN